MKAELYIAQAAKECGRQEAIWSIGIFSGPTLASLKPVPGTTTPVLSAQDVTDVPALFVADPFMIQVGNIWHMFFEVMNAKTGKGEIGFASSRDGLDWQYKQIVLTEPFHLSYPYVFCIGKDYFMIPESYVAGAMRLYRANPFPIQWSHIATLLEGPWVDSSIFFFDGRWWVFSSPVSAENRVLELFHADSLEGPWQRHPMSPLINGDGRKARCGGRVIVANNRPVRFTQDCFPFYGTAIRAFEISVLTKSSYIERELEFSPTLYAGEELWRRQGMHHIDPHLVNDGWLACVDGWRFEPLAQQELELLCEKLALSQQELAEVRQELALSHQELALRDHELAVSHRELAVVCQELTTTREELARVSSARTLRLARAVTAVPRRAVKWLLRPSRSEGYS